MKTIVALVLGTAILASGSAFAAEPHKCKSGEHWDTKTMSCVKKTKK